MVQPAAHRLPVTDLENCFHPNYFIWKQPDKGRGSCGGTPWEQSYWGLRDKSGVCFHTTLSAHTHTNIDRVIPQVALNASVPLLSSPDSNLDPQHTNTHTPRHSKSSQKLAISLELWALSIGAPLLAFIEYLWRCRITDEQIPPLIHISTEHLNISSTLLNGCCYLLELCCPSF